MDDWGDVPNFVFRFHDMKQVQYKTDNKHTKVYNWEVYLFKKDTKYSELWECDLIGQWKRICIVVTSNTTQDRKKRKYAQSELSFSQWDDKDI